MSNYHHEIGDEIAVSNTQTVRIIRALAEGWTQDPDSDYIQQTMDNKLEVYEAETIRDSYAGNIGNHEIVVSDNASCWLWGNQDDAATCSEHLALLEAADIKPDAWIEDIDSPDLRDYVAGCVFAALESRVESEPDDAERGKRYKITVECDGWGRVVYRNTINAEEALRLVSDQHEVVSHTQLMYDAGTRGDEWATWCCTDTEGAMRGVRITATREGVDNA